MLLNCDVGEDSWESLALQGDPTSPSSRKSVLNIHWKDWCWTWNSNTLTIWCEELTHLERPWCYERLKAGEEGEDRGWDGWMASPTQWIWVWLNSGSWWCCSPRGHKELDLTEQLNWAIMKTGVQIIMSLLFICLDMCLGRELLGHMAILCLTFWGTNKQFTLTAPSFYIPTTMQQVSNFSTFWLTVVTFCFIDYSHPSRCEVKTTCFVNLLAWGFLDFTGTQNLNLYGLIHVNKSSAYQVISIQGLWLPQQASYHHTVQVSRFLSATISLKGRPPKALIYREYDSIHSWSEEPVPGSPLKPKLTPYFSLSPPFPELQQNQLSDFLLGFTYLQPQSKKACFTCHLYLCDPKGFSSLYCNFSYSFKYINLILL